MDELIKIQDDITLKIGDLQNGSSDINLENITLRIGGHVCRLEKVEDIDISDNLTDIKNEYKQKVNERLSEVSTFVNEKMIEYKRAIDSIKSEYRRKENEVDERLKTLVSMPDVSLDHATKGLSISKGSSGAGSISWYVRRMFNPKFVDGKPLKETIVKKMITPIIIQIDTTGSRITRVSTRKFMDLRYFDHYHQSGPDCWGNWKHPVTWETPDDIIAVADEAISVLENVNSMSLAMRAPAGLPRFTTLRRNIVDGEVSNVDSRIAPRIGATDELDVWGS